MLIVTDYEPINTFYEPINTFNVPSPWEVFMY